MYTYEEQCMMDLSDNYTLLYSFMGRELIDTFGLEGERALREGTRRYGRDRSWLQSQYGKLVFDWGRFTARSAFSQGTAGVESTGKNFAYSDLSDGRCLERK